MKIILLMLAVTALIALVFGLFKAAQNAHSASTHPPRIKGVKRTWRKVVLAPAWFQLFIALVTAKPPRLQATFANIGEGVYEHGIKLYLVDNSASARYLLYKQGSGADHVDVCTSADVPLGPSDDQADTSNNIGLAVKLLGAAKGTMLVVTDGSLANGDLVISADAGKVRKLLTTTGTYYIIGKAQISSDMSSANGDNIGMIPCFPTQRVVA